MERKVPDYRHSDFYSDLAANLRIWTGSRIYASIPAGCGQRHLLRIFRFLCIMRELRFWKHFSDFGNRCIAGLFLRSINGYVSRCKKCVISDSGAYTDHPAGCHCTAFDSLVFLRNLAEGNSGCAGFIFPDGGGTFGRLSSRWIPI